MVSHSTSSDGYAVRARWVFPVASPPQPGGVLTVRDGRIAALGANASGEPPLDLGDVAILPGLVNAHTHLEFSSLRQPLGEPGMPFPLWIREVIAWRRERDADAALGRQRRETATALGLRESLAAGVTTVGEIAAPGWPAGPFRETPLDCLIFQELLGLEPERREYLLDLARNHLDAGPEAGHWRLGLSPHAPYTTPLEVVEASADLSHRNGVPVAMHLAESPEEMELLHTGRGLFRDLLSGLGPRFAELAPQGLRPLDYLTRLARAARALAIHGNYLNRQELSFLAEHAATMSVVYCPRTHRYFRHARYPLSEMLHRGVRVALGTDSRGSNPDLSLWNEMQFVARHFPDVPPATVLRLGTLAGAEALGLGAECGSLTVARRADLTLVALPSRRADDPHELLFDEASRIAGVYVAGRRVE